MEVNNGNKSDSMEKIEKQINSKIDEIIRRKVYVKCFGFNVPSSKL